MNTTAKQTLNHARQLQSDMRAAGHGDVRLADAYLLCRIGQLAAAQTEEKLRRDARAERVRKGMVAGYVADMRAVGAWDGE